MPEPEKEIRESVNKAAGGNKVKGGAKKGKKGESGVQKAARKLTK